MCAGSVQAIEIVNLQQHETERDHPPLAQDSRSSILSPSQCTGQSCNTSKRQAQGTPHARTKQCTYVHASCLMSCYRLNHSAVHPTAQSHSCSHHPIHAGHAIMPTSHEFYHVQIASAKLNEADAVHENLLVHFGNLLGILRHAWMV